jgi:hypothetical protein
MLLRGDVEYGDPMVVMVFLTSPNLVEVVQKVQSGVELDGRVMWLT